MLHEVHQLLCHERLQRALREAEADGLALQTRGQRQRRRRRLVSAGLALLQGRKEAPADAHRLAELA